MADYFKGGGVWSCGWNNNGQLGYDLEDPGETMSCNRPKFVESLMTKRVIKVAAASSHSLFLTDEYQVFSCGSGSFGRLGHGTKDDVHTPKLIENLALQKIIHISAGPDHSLAVSSEGEVWAWGCGFSGRLGTDEPRSTSVPKTVCNLRNKKIVYAAAGGASSAAVTDKGELFTWGYNEYGQLGIGEDAGPPMVENDVLKSFETKAKLVRALQDRFVVRVECGARHTAALCNDNTFWIWGNNEFGQLGLGDQKDRDVPQRSLLDPRNAHQEEIIVDFALGEYHTAAVTNTGELYTWGKSHFGRLGYEVSNSFAAIIHQRSARGRAADRGDPQLTPKKVNVIKEFVVQVSCGVSHTAAVTRENRMYVFGWDKYGQLGLGPWDEKKLMEITNGIPGDIHSYPVINTFMCRIKSVTLGWFHTIILIEDPKDMVLQHCIDGNQPALEYIVDNTSKPKQLIESAVDGLTGMTAAHLLALYNQSHLTTFLNNLHVNLHVRDYSKKTAIHIACEKGHLEFLKKLLQISTNRTDLILECDADGNSCLHLATKNRHFEVAQLLVQLNKKALDIKNNNNEFALDLISFEEGFQFKVMGQKHDVAIYCAAVDLTFAMRLSESVEKYFVKCWLAKQTSTSEIEKQFTAAKGIVFIVSKRAVSAPDFGTLLEFAKEQKKKIFPIWKEKFDLDPNTERLLYRTQLVDFSDNSKFNENVSFLVAGLRNLFMAPGAHLHESSRMEDKEDLVADDEPEEGSQEQEHYVFISFGASDLPIVQEVQKHFAARNIQTVLSNSIAASKISSAIVKSSYFICVISDKSLKSPSHVLDHVALAENHRRFILPLFVDWNIELPPSMQYTLANVPKFFLPRGEKCYEQLVFVIQTNEKVKKLNAQVRVLEEKWTPLEERLQRIRRENQMAKATYVVALDS
mmetsp:Transcript_17752/g.24697  ORF Transcript_17752/g.24697 Transcript_17752/m.24697 type:complete len:915 (+) Transcript_17752:33-2777(+)